MDQNDVRKVLLEVTEAMQGESARLVLQEAAHRLNVGLNNTTKGQVILTCWSDLFRNGVLAWGLDVANPDPPHFHMTQRGRQALKHLSRDPSNPDGYLAYLESHITLDPVARSYLEEALNTYNTSCFKASAVMVGAAAERLVLQLSEAVVSRMTALGWHVAPALKDWKVKAVRDALAKEFEKRKADMPKELFESFTAYWTGLGEQMRKVRNDAGHPESIAPVSPESVHASLLIFPELAKLVHDLGDWVNAFYK